MNINGAGTSSIGASISGNTGKHMRAQIAAQTRSTGSVCALCCARRSSISLATFAPDAGLRTNARCKSIMSMAAGISSVVRSDRRKQCGGKSWHPAAKAIRYSAQIATGSSDTRTTNASGRTHSPRAIRRWNPPERIRCQGAFWSVARQREPQRRSVRPGVSIPLSPVLTPKTARCLSSRGSAPYSPPV